MNSSIAVQDYQLQWSPAIAIVEQLPSIPESYEKIVALQKEKTDLYWLNDLWGESSVTKIVTNDAPDYGAVQQHVKKYLDGAYFADGAITQLISENIDELF